MRTKAPIRPYLRLHRIQPRTTHTSNPTQMSQTVPSTTIKIKRFNNRLRTRHFRDYPYINVHGTNLKRTRRLLYTTNNSNDLINMLIKRKQILRANGMMNGTLRGRTMMRRYATKEPRYRQNTKMKRTFRNSRQPKYPRDKHLIMRTIPYNASRSTVCDRPHGTLMNPRNDFNKDARLSISTGNQSTTLMNTRRMRMRLRLPRHYTKETFTRRTQMLTKTRTKQRRLINSIIMRLM